MGKVENRSDRVISIPDSLFTSAGQLGKDVIDTLNGALFKDATSVILNTKHKIADLFSKDLKRYHYIGNAPVAVGVGLAGAVEAVAKTVVNGLANTGKTAGNLISNARKSTLGSVFSTKPVSDISFNHRNTANPVRKRDSIVTKNWGILTKDAKIKYYTDKLRDLGVAA